MVNNFKNVVKDILNTYRVVFKQYPIYKVFAVLLLLKAIIFSAYVWDVKYMKQLNDLIGLAIIVVCFIITFKINSHKK